MKILIIITDLGSYLNFLFELGNELISRGHEVEVLCSKNKVIKKESNNIDPNIVFNYVEIPRKISPIGFIKASIEIRKKIRDSNPDIIHSHFTTSIFASSLALIGHKHCVFIGTFHGLNYIIEENVLRKIAYYIIDRFSFSQLNKIIVLNQTDFENVHKHFPDKVVKTNYLGLGCSLESFSPTIRNSKESIRKRENMKLSNRTTIGFTGRFVHFKGFHLVVKAFNLLNSKYPGKFALILIGGKDQAHESGLNSNEYNLLESNPDIIQTGFSNYVHKELAIVDVFVFPSFKEGLPISITEALCMGIPVITINSRGCKDLINSKNGIIIEKSKDQEILVNRIVKSIMSLTRDKKLYQKLEKGALETRIKLSRKSFIEEEIHFYEKMYNEQ